MAYTSTYSNLMAIELDIITQSKTSAWFRHSNQEKMRRFFTDNAVRIAIAKKTIQALIEKHIILDDDGKPLKDLDSVKYMFYTPEAETAYAAEMKAFLNTNITIC